MKVDFDTPVERRGSDSAKWRNAGETLPMFVADMDFRTPPQIVEAIQKRAAEGMFGYMTPPDSYYDSILRWHRERNGFDVKREWISFSPGVVTGFCLAIEALTKPGDRVIIQPPIYPPFYSAVQNSGRVLVENELVRRGDRYEIDFAQFESLAKEAAMFLLCSPHNPTGRLWSRQELSRMAEICLANGVTIVSDEIHSDLIYPGKSFVPIASLSPEVAEITVAVTAPSKTFNIPGLRHAYAIIPGAENRRRFREFAGRRLHLDEGGIFGYYAAQAGYEHCADWLSQLMEYVAGNDRFLRETLARRLPMLRCTEAEATYLAWVDFSGLGLSEEALNSLLDRAKLHLGPGRDFSPHCALFKRITLGCPRAYVEEAVNRLEAAVAGLR